MAEKTDLPTDNVSLPPTYAPSEAFTDSPPPAYRQSGVAAVKVAKIVCITLLLMTFIIGFFVVSHKWVQGSQMHKQEHEALPESLAFVDNEIQEPIAKIIEHKEEMKQEVQSEDIIEKLEEEEPIPEMPVEESSVEELPIEDLPVPRNPKVKCRVQRKQNKVGNVIMTQTVMVICDDQENDIEDESSEDIQIMPPGMRRLNKPPMSLLGNLMKILASRPRSNEMPREEQRPFLRPINGPIPFGPFPMSRHNHGPFQGPFPVRGGRMIPINKIELRRPIQMLEGANLRPRPILMTPRGPFPMMRPNPMFRKIIMGSPNPNGPPAPPHFMFNQRRVEEDEERSPIPFPFRNGAIPIRVIRLNHNNNAEDFENSEGPLLPFNPMMNFNENPRIRVIHLRPREEDDDVIHITRELPPIHLPPPMIMEPRGRALPAPVAIPDPEMRVFRFPIEPQHGPFIHPEARVSAGLEVQSQEDVENNHPAILTRGNSNQAEFGPPKTHSVIEAIPKNFGTNQEESQFRPRFLARQGPVNFSPEDRINFELSDAVTPSSVEPIVLPMNRFHRMIIN